MSFHLERLTLTDWLAYEGSNTIDFGSHQEGKNLWVVYGMNGAGKTSLLRAIQWVFHNKMPERQIKGCFNKNALRAGRTELSVMAEFRYNNQNYRLTRRAAARDVDQQEGIVHDNPRIGVELAINDTLVSTGSEDDQISQILPKECQKFFFFDGLEIQEYASPHVSETRDAIERVLGIPEVRNLAEDLGKLRSELARERDQALQGAQEYEALSLRKDEAEIQLSAAEETLQNLLKKRINLDELIKGLKERTERLERVKDDVERLRDYTIRHKELEDRLSRYDVELRGLLGIVTKRMLLPNLRLRTSSLETEVSVAERTTLKLADAKARIGVVDNLLEQMACICGREMNPEATKHLEELLADLQRQAEQTETLSAQSGTIRGKSNEKQALDNLITRIENERSPQDIENALLRKYELEVQAEELAKSIAGLKQELADHNDTEVSEVYRVLGERETEHRNLGADIGAAETGVQDATRQVREIEKEMNQLAQELPHQEQLIATLEQTEAAQSMTTELVEQIVALRRKAVEENLTRVFRSITNKKDEYDRIELEENYNLVVRTQGGNTVQSAELSAGEKEVVAFSFIAGLNLSTETHAPLVMDTPFGHLDVEHRDGLLQALPTLPCQVILLATNRDLPYEDVPSLDYCLGGTWQITREQNQERSLIDEWSH